MIQARAVQASGAGPGYVVSRTLPRQRNRNAWFLQEAALCTGPALRRRITENLVPVKFDRDLSRSRFAGALSAAELHRCGLTDCGNRRNMNRRHEFESTNSDQGRG